MANLGVLNGEGKQPTAQAGASGRTADSQPWAMSACGRPIDVGVKRERSALEANNTHRRLQHDEQQNPFVPALAEA